MYYVGKPAFKIDYRPFDGGEVTYKADGVVCALGLRSVNQLALVLQEKGYPIDVIGDAYEPRKILNAVHEGYHSGRRA